MMSNHGSPRIPTEKKPPLEKVLTKTRQIRKKMESYAIEVFTANETVRQRIGAGSSLLEAKKVLARSKGFEDKIQGCADELHEVNNVLAQEIDERHTVNRKLINTLQLLSTTKDISSAPEDILAIAHEVVEEAKKRTLLDSATGIPNRELFNNRLEQGIAIAQRCDWDLALLFIDLDRFKFINDTFGHPVGDKALQMVARRLSDQARAADTICRYGGNEFLYLLLNPKGRKNIQRIAHRIFDHVSQPLIIDDLVLSIELSIVIAMYPECGETGAELISNADVAMYQAKKTKAGIANYDEYTKENLNKSQKKERVTAEVDMEKERKLFEKFYMEYRGFYKWLFDRDKKNHHRYQAALTNREFDSWLAAAFDSEYGLTMKTII